MGHRQFHFALATTALIASSFGNSSPAQSPQNPPIEKLAQQMAMGDRPGMLDAVAQRLRAAQEAWGAGEVDPAWASALETEIALTATSVRESYLWKNALQGIDVTDAAPPVAAAMAWRRQDTRELNMLTSWQFVGPFDNERGRGMTRSTPAEKDPAGGPYDGKLREVPWRVTPEPGHDGIVYLGALVAPSSQVCVLARTWIQATEARSATLLVSASEELRVWWNGTPVYDALGLHEFGTDGHAVSVYLSEGWNELVVKVGSQDERPMFAARLVDSTTGASLSLPVSPTAPDGVAPRDLVDPGRRLRRGSGTTAPGARAFYASKTDPHSVTSRSILAASSRSVPRKERPGHADAAGAFIADPESIAAAMAMLNTMRIDGALDVEEDVNPWLDVLNQTIERHGPLPQLMSWYADFTMESQDLARRALDLTEQALKAHPSSVLSRLDEVDYLAAIGQDALALRAASKLASEDDIQRWPQECMGLRRYFSAHDPEAARLVQIAADAGNVSAQDALRDAAEIAAGTLDTVELDRMTRERLLERNYDISLRLNAGRRLMAAGSAELALAHFDDALQLIPESSRVLSWRGRALLALGDRAGAVDAIAKSCEFEPSNADELRLLNYLKSTTEGTDAGSADDDFHVRYAEPVTAIAARHPRDDAAAGGGTADAPREVLLNRRVVKVGADGKARRYRRTVERVLSEAGVRQLDRRNFRSFPGSEDLRVLSVRVLHPDGTIDEGETGRGPRLSIDLPPLDVGDVVDIEWRRDDITTSIFGSYFGLNASFSQDASLPTREADITLLEPAETKLYYHLAGADDSDLEVAATEETLEDGTLARTWSTKDLKPRRSENLEPPAREHTLRLQASTYENWESFGNWWWNLIREEIAVSPEMSEKVAELTRDKETRLEKLRAVYDFVVTDVRYNAWEFGVHGYQPYSAPVIFSRRFGDCKDKAILLRAMLSEVGIEAWPVLIQSEGRRFEEDHELPLVAHFNHCIAHVPAQDGIPEMFLDGTARLHPLEVLPDSDAGAKVLTVRSDGAEQMQIPFASAEVNVQRETIDIGLSTKDSIQVSFRQAPKGRWDPKLRYRFATDEAQRAEAAEALMTARFGALKGDVVAVHPDYEDLNQDLVLELQAQLERVGQRVENRLELPTNFAPYRLEQGLASESERTTDVLLDVPWTIERQITYYLPADATDVQLPKDVEFETPDIRFRRRCSQGESDVDGWSDDALHVTCTETLELRTHRVPLERYDSFRDAARRVDAAQRQNISVEVPQ